MSPTFPTKLTHPCALLDPTHPRSQTLEHLAALLPTLEAMARQATPDALDPRARRVVTMQTCRIPGQHEGDIFLVLDGDQLESLIHRLYADRELDTEQEHLLLLMSDRRGHIDTVEHIASGMHRSIQTDVDAICRSAVSSGAAYIFAVHNHPSGDLVASEDDQCLAAHLISATRMLGIELLDHIIHVPDGRCASTRMQCPALWSDALDSKSAA